MTVYPAASTGNAAPSAIINRAFALSLTGLAQPAGIAVNGAGITCTNTNDNSVTIYSAGSTGNAAPSFATISGSNTGLGEPTGIALDAVGNIYVANSLEGTVTILFSGEHRRCRHDGNYQHRLLW